MRKRSKINILIRDYSLINGWIMECSLIQDFVNEWRESVEMIWMGDMNERTRSAFPTKYSTRNTFGCKFIIYMQKKLFRLITIILINRIIPKLRETKSQKTSTTKQRREYLSTLGWVRHVKTSEKIEFFVQCTAYTHRNNAEWAKTKTLFLGWAEFRAKMNENLDEIERKRKNSQKHKKKKHYSNFISSTMPRLLC